MFFFSIEFGLAFLAFFVVYWLLRAHHRLQNLLLLAFNYAILCYFGSVYFVLVLACFTLFIYAASHAISQSESKSVFLACVAFVVLNLSFFKYFASFKDGFENLLRFFGLDVADIDVLLPLGLSFYSFASITYLRAVYEAKRGFSDYVLLKNPKLESLPDLAAYLSFFPTIIAGPIMRSDMFFAQFKSDRFWRAKNAHPIIVLLLLGIVKKVLIATYIQEYTLPILTNPLNYNIAELLIGIFGYSVQIYCDFSGYVNLVCAFALMLGFTLPPNFNMPYTARNLKDFWARWHISLSTFIRDFIYIPLGGSRKGFWLTQLFVLIAFGLSGIWHGNTINFMIWGLLHGFGLVVLNALKALDLSFGKSRVGAYLASLVTFCFVSFAWVFFCYKDFGDSLAFLSAFGENLHKSIGISELIVLACGLIFFSIYPYFRNLERASVYYLYKIPPLLKPFLLGAFLLVVFCLMPDGIPNFIYAGF
ncbi:membrane-bound O-acyltransferase family protein [Helicobacter sp. CLO-3]|uniref:MBOAT family O-acyltransferase n=1 Tax=unclassified Helicobacter TaxID=2593540 RepID=UPI000805B973|nr:MULTISPECIES: MBOAT family O-acyltransferase [unclassified Helicobacter]OBV29376.1 acyltransferase [Helicobacter sp. CLO-3]OHU84157.1 membrane-bound O-acyltransferase family protein [Helicobacter sp. CLO-3]